MLLELEIFKLIHLKAFYDYESSALKRVRQFTDREFPNFGTKVMNTTFVSPKTRDDYDDPQLLSKYRNNPGLLKQKLETPLENPLGVKKFKEIIDIFIGLNHKVSGCNKYLKSLLTALKSLDPDERKEFKHEVERIEKEIMKRAREWEKYINHALKVITSTTKGIITKVPKYEPLLLPLVNSLKMHSGDYLQKLRVKDEGKPPLEKNFSELKSITANISLLALLSKLKGA